MHFPDCLPGIDLWFQYLADVFCQREENIPELRAGKLKANQRGHSRFSFGGPDLDVKALRLWPFLYARKHNRGNLRKQGFKAGLDLPRCEHIKNTDTGVSFLDEESPPPWVFERVDDVFELISQSY